MENSRRGLGLVIVKVKRAAATACLKHSKLHIKDFAEQNMRFLNNFNTNKGENILVMIVLSCLANCVYSSDTQT